MDQTDNPLPHGSVNTDSEDWSNSFFLGRLPKTTITKAVKQFEKEKRTIPEELLKEHKKRNS